MLHNLITKFKQKQNISFAKLVNRHLSNTIKDVFSQILTSHRNWFIYSHVKKFCVVCFYNSFIIEEIFNRIWRENILKTKFVGLPSVGPAWRVFQQWHLHEHFFIHDSRKHCVCTCSRERPASGTLTSTADQRALFALTSFRADSPTGSGATVTENNPFGIPSRRLKPAQWDRILQLTLRDVH